MGKTQKWFQYSLCRVVLMVERPEVIPVARPAVSVLALSSRFDGPGRTIGYLLRCSVSVLALSSRFDGPGTTASPESSAQSFSTRSVESF